MVLLCQLHHPNLVPLIEYCIAEGENILVFEFIVKGNLFRRLHYTDHDDHDRLSWKQRLQIRIGVALALHYLHILLDENWEFKLSDFKSFKMVILGFVSGLFLKSPRKIEKIRIL